MQKAYAIVAESFVFERKTGIELLKEAGDANSRGIILAYIGVI